MANLSLIATNQERAMLKAFLDAVDEIKNTTKITQLERLIELRDFDGVIKLLGLDASAFEGMEDQLYQSFRTGGITGANQIGIVPTPIGDVNIKFNIAAPEAQQWIRTNSSKMITEMVTGQTEMVRDVLSDGLTKGLNPRTQALDLVGRIAPTGNRVGGMVGLTTQQAQWVSSAREELESLDANYFTRKLRDKRFDSTIRKAIDSGEPLTQAQINKAITQMQNRTLKYRGDVIARTESIKALRAGQHNAVTQSVETGEADFRDVSRIWDSSEDKRTRLDHLQMEGQEVGYLEPFTFPDGSRAMFPSDDSLGAPASQLIQCRCKEVTKIDFLGQLKRIEGFS